MKKYITAILLVILIHADLFCLDYFHVLKEVSQDKITLQDQSEWTIGWWHQTEIQKWSKGDRLKITCHINTSWSNNVEFQNLDTPGEAWGIIKKWPDSKTNAYIVQISSWIKNGATGSSLTLNSGMTFESPYLHEGWRQYDSIMIFHWGNRYNLFNITTNQWLLHCTFEHKVIPNVLTLEKRLSQRVLDQPEATRAVAAAMINYSARLKDPTTPIKTFLFLGPTGVGKTELAKALTDEVYHNRSFLLRFDMSHFTEHSIYRLIGTPPGYIDSDKGGQLTEPLKRQPQAVVLLDEFEKAHPSVHKVFLPVFDEGYITNAFAQKIPCNHAIFIMTSNLCSDIISSLFEAGYTPEQILTKIESTIVQAISPELYARVEPIVFRPLSLATMEKLIDIMLREVIDRVRSTHQISLIIDDSVKKYLKENGFHPKFGARPLKALIQNKVVTTLSYSILKENIPPGTTVTLMCSDADNLKVVY